MQNHTHSCKILRLTFICRTFHDYTSHIKLLHCRGKMLQPHHNKCISSVMIKSIGSVGNWLQLQSGLEKICFHHYKIMFWGFFVCLIFLFFIIYLFIFYDHPNNSLWARFILLFLKKILNIFIDYAIIVVPFLPLHSTPSCPPPPSHIPPALVHVHGSYI